MTPEAAKHATYLGDGVYALWNGEDIRLFTHDGYKDTNVIFLEPDVQINLIRFLEGIIGGRVKPVDFNLGES